MWQVDRKHSIHAFSNFELKFETLLLFCVTPQYSNTFSPSKLVSGGSLDTNRIDDEHRLIARYAARLAADANNAVSNSLPHITIMCTNLITSSIHFVRRDKKRVSALRWLRVRQENASQSMSKIVIETADGTSFTVCDGKAIVKKYP